MPRVPRKVYLADDDDEWGEHNEGLVHSLIDDAPLAAQGFFGQSVSADNVYLRVKSMKQRGNSWWWQGFRVVLCSFSEEGEVVCQLHCKLCDIALSPSHPSDAGKHFKPGMCRGYREGVQQGIINPPRPQQPTAGPSSSSSSSSSDGCRKRQATLQGGGGAHQLRIDDMRGQKERAKEFLFLFFITRMLPPSLIEDAYLKACFECLGINLPSRWGEVLF